MIYSAGRIIPAPFFDCRRRNGAALPSFYPFCLFLQACRIVVYPCVFLLPSPSVDVTFQKSQVTPPPIVPNVLAADFQRRPSFFVNCISSKLRMTNSVSIPPHFSPSFFPTLSRLCLSPPPRFSRWSGICLVLAFECSIKRCSFSGWFSFPTAVHPL